MCYCLCLFAGDNTLAMGNEPLPVIHRLLVRHFHGHFAHALPSSCSVLWMSRIQPTSRCGPGPAIFLAFPPLQAHSVLSPSTVAGAGAIITVPSGPACQTVPGARLPPTQGQVPNVVPGLIGCNRGCCSRLQRTAVATHVCSLGLIIYLYAELATRS